MKILGLDLGVASIGWAVIEIDDEDRPINILGIGSRVINLRQNEDSDFSKGKGESVCSSRTFMRTARKCLDRYQLRRANLISLGVKYGLIDKGHVFPPLNPLEIWELRAKSATDGKKVTLSQLMRVLLHINQKRGYKHAKSDSVDSKTTEYVDRINERYADIKSKNKTVGQYFAEKMRESETVTESGCKFYSYRIREKVLPRQAYMDEFDSIMRVQHYFYPEILDSKTIAEFRNAIFYQRPLKSCKHLVSFCEFEKKLFKNKSGKLVQSGPRVAPMSSPLSQAERIYEAINNIRLVNQAFRKKELKFTVPSLFERETSRIPMDAKKCRYEYVFDDEERERIFDFMFTHEKMSESDLLKILGLKKSDGFKSDRSLGKGIQGNPTYCKIKNAISDMPDFYRLLEFRLKIEDSNNCDKETGEVLQTVSSDFSDQPLFKLWHTLYSISEREELAKVLNEKFGINDPETVFKLFAIDFVASGYANKSTKFMRKLIPLLQQGYGYSEACAKLGINHSNSLTKEQNDARELKDRIDLLPKNSLRQPTVEKILNQMINLVNSIKAKYGEIQEVRVELARELKQSKEERLNATRDIAKREKENELLKKKIADFGVFSSRRRIQKMRMLEETGNRCIYCGTPVTPSLFIEGHGYEVEHIIPRSKVFDDSFSNKVCSCRECNKSKGNMTGFDFMEARSEQDLSDYVARVEALYKEKKISRIKRNNLLTREKDINAGFIERDLRLSQYISRKARLLLMEGFRNVYASSGAVTDFFRHAWGYDMILHNLNFLKYKKADLTEEVEYSHNGQIHRELRIKGWSKRKDHRHHSIDALVVALTRQGYVQRLSTLNAENPDFDKKKEAKYNLDKWAARQPHFSTSMVADAVEEVSVSFKAGKKLAVPGKRYVVRGGKRICVQKKILVPRGALHKDTIYGIIKSDKILKNLTKALENPDLIVDSKVKEVLLKRFSESGMEISSLKRSLKKNPIINDGKEVDVDKILCFSEDTVVKYPIESVTHKDVKSIVDGKIRDIIAERFKECDDNDKKFVQSLKDSPIYSDVTRDLLFVL